MGDLEGALVLGAAEGALVLGAVEGALVLGALDGILVGDFEGTELGFDELGESVGM